jgi:hypothetical protein
MLLLSRVQYAAGVCSRRKIVSRRRRGSRERKSEEPKYCSCNRRKRRRCRARGEGGRRKSIRIFPALMPS